MQVRSIRQNACVKYRAESRTCWLWLVLLLCSDISLVNGEEGIKWSEKFYNPQPAGGDIVLPMPCGGAMAFRPIEVESDQPLDDLQITVGNASDEWGFAENPHIAFLTGAFSSSSKSRYFLLGKYEVSELQFDAVISQDCPSANMRGRLPKTRVGWFDVVDFSNRYSLWLRNHASGAGGLPSEDGESGFIRLPTEDEWEYAARGGGVVSPSDFREKVYPMEAGIVRYEWYAGTASANGKPQLTGLLEANPLGLHDMLGNVGEISMDLFRLNRLDRLHGQVGGYVVRGGNYLTAAADLRSSHRQEVPFYKHGEQLRSKTTGFRAVVSAPVITSSSHLHQIIEAWNKLGSESTQGPKSRYAGLEGKTFDDPVAELAAVAKVIEDENLKLRVTRLRDTMRANIEERNRQRNQAARESLRLGGVLCQKLKDDGLAIDGLKKVYSNCVDARGKDHELCTKFGTKLEGEQQVLNYNTGIYSESVIGTAQNYPAETLGRQLELLTSSLEKREFGGLVSFVKRYYEQAQVYATNWRVRRDEWYAQCADSD